MLKNSEFMADFVNVEKIVDFKTMTKKVHLIFAFSENAFFSQNFQENLRKLIVCN